MRTLRVMSHLLILPLCVAGCASTSSVSPKMQTVASVGDKRLPVTTGSPEDLVRADRPSPFRSRRAEGRISGRVYDESGDPVPNARIRLAVGDDPGGKVVGAKTDGTGAFTLSGMRPGSTYRLIAEAEDGALVGRSEVKAPDTDVRISLASAETEPAPVAKTGRPKRVSPASEREAIDEEEDRGEDVPGAIKPKVNHEDIEPPPAAEADSVLPEETRSPAPPRQAARSPRWRRGSAAGTAAPKAESAPGASPAPQDPAAHGASGSIESPAHPAGDDDGPNPLPPAIEPGQSGHSALPAPAGPQIAAQSPAPETAEADAESLARSDSLADEILESKPAVVHSAQKTVDPKALAQADPSAPADATASLLEALGQDGGEPAPAKEPASSEDVAEAPFPEAAKPPLEPSPGPSQKPPGRKRRTWGEVAAVAATTPMSREGLDPAGGTAQDGPPQEGVSGRPRAAPRPPDDGRSYCDYDARHRQIRDFRLPDLQGRPVRFQDIDADLILLDFWGTWCQPCLQSVPHLVEIQKRMGASRVKVVGIACEQGPPQQRAQDVAKTAQRLGINYPVLLSGMDGPCPLQEALHVQAYPTLILVDRQGRIVWKDQGATRMTLARLDRFLASATQPDSVRRY